MVLARLDSTQTKQKLVVTSLPLAHRWIVCSFSCDDIWTANLVDVVACFQVTRWIRALQSLLCLDSRDDWTVACVELASVKFTILSNSGRHSCHPTALDIKIGATTCHRVAISIEIDVDLCHRSATTILTLIVESFSFSLSKSLLLLVVEVRIAIQGNSLRVIGLRADLEETFLGVESWRQLLRWIFFYHNRVKLLGFVVLRQMLVHHWFLLTSRCSCWLTWWNRRLLRSSLSPKRWQLLLNAHRLLLRTIASNADALVVCMGE